MLECAQEWGVKRVSIASSIAVYNGVPAGPFSEDLTLRPIATHTTEAYKKTYEIVASYHALETGLDYVAMRIAGIYGPVHHSRYHQITRLALAAMQGQTTDAEREVYADDGTDYCYVKDCADAIVALQTAPSLPQPRVQHRRRPRDHARRGRGRDQRRVARRQAVDEAGQRRPLAPQRLPRHHAHQAGHRLAAAVAARARNPRLHGVAEGQRGLDAAKARMTRAF